MRNNKKKKRVKNKNKKIKFQKFQTYLNGKLSNKRKMLLDNILKN